MATLTHSLYLLLVIANSLISANATSRSTCDCGATSSSSIGRGNFPEGFVFGAAASAYQVIMFDENTYFRFLFPFLFFFFFFVRGDIYSPYPYFPVRGCCKGKRERAELVGQFHARLSRFCPILRGIENFHSMIYTFVIDS